MFLADACLGRACYGKCKYGLDSSSADIRIGDFWGNKYRENEEGISALAAFTEKGKETVRQLDRCVLTPETFAVVAEGQKKRRPAAPLLRKYLIRQFRKKAAFDKAARVLELQRNIWRALRYIRNFPRMMYRLLIKIKP
jgi:hypothetical protein